MNIFFSRYRGALPFLSGLLIAGCFSGCQVPPTKTYKSVLTQNWSDRALWTTNSDMRSSVVVSQAQTVSGEGLEVQYQLKGNFGFVEIQHRLDTPVREDQPIVFNLKAQATGDIELKFYDKDGSILGRKLPLAGAFSEWTRFVIYTNNLEYWWGGDSHFSGLTEFMIAFSGQGQGTVWLDQIGTGKSKLPTTLTAGGPVLDPDRELPGTGIRQRRDAELIPEDPLVLEWLKANQDTCSKDQKLLGSMEDHCLQTFNNALTAMAFLLDGEKERAERILDFFAGAAKRDNMDPTLQNFFYRGEARGFFQNAILVYENGQPVYRAEGKSDRWMGDMVWLMFTYKYYDRLYGSERYAEIEGLILDLLASWYKKAGDGHGGYVQSGWRKGDSQLHESGGHHEGNIDAYALYKLLGDEKRAQSIREWLDSQLKGEKLPLDLYTWRVMAFGKDSEACLNIPDYDLRYRKTVPFNGRDVVGVFHSADESVNNIWVDGVGHMACAYFAVGNLERGNFYANQLDRLLIDRNVGGIACRGIPYTANTSAGFDGIRTDMGFVSPAAWYIFAKHRFNPMTLQKTP